MHSARWDFYAALVQYVLGPLVTFALGHAHGRWMAGRKKPGSEEG